MIVVDTSVMVQLLTGANRGSQAALLLKEDPEWAAPTVLLSELRAVMAGLQRRGKIRPSDAVEVCRDAEAVLGDRLATVPAGSVLEIAAGSELTPYDAEFVVLARRLGVPLFTSDPTILAEAPDVAVPLKGK